MTRGSGGARVVAAAVVVAALAGCGVTTQAEPEVINRDEVPFGLLKPSEGRGTAPAPAEATVSTVVYFVAPGGLAASLREARGPLDAAIVLDLLARGPTAAEARAGLRSALVPDGAVRVAVDNGRAIVGLGPEFLQLSRAEQGLAVAQIVYTLTELENVSGVRFEASGQRLTVPVRGGDPTSRPIDRSQVVIPGLTGP